MQNDDDDEIAALSQRPLNIGFTLADDTLAAVGGAGTFAVALAGEIADLLVREDVQIDVWHCDPDLIFGVFCFKLAAVNVMLTLRWSEDGDDSGEWWLSFSTTPGYTALSESHRETLIMLFLALAKYLAEDDRMGLVKVTLPPEVTLHGLQ